MVRPIHMDLAKKQKLVNRVRVSFKWSYAATFYYFEVLWHISLRHHLPRLGFSQPFESSRCAVTLVIYNTNTTTRTSGSMCDTVRLALDELVLFSLRVQWENTYTWEWQNIYENSSTLPESTFPYFVSAPQNRGTLTQIAYAVHAKHPNLCFFPAGVLWNPLPLQYMIIYICIHIYIQTFICKQMWT